MKIRCGWLVALLASSPALSAQTSACDQSITAVVPVRIAARDAARGNGDVATRAANLKQVARDVQQDLAHMDKLFAKKQADN
jgi:hypothetical protein